MKTLLRTLSLSGLFVSATAHIGLCQAVWSPGDVFVAIGNGQYNVYHNSGTATSPTYGLIETLTDGSANGFTYGCAFDSSSNLYTTNFTNTKVYKFDANSHFVLQTIDTNLNDPSGHSESALVDSSANLYVGDPDGVHLLLKYDRTGAFLTSFAPTIEARGTDWIDLAADQKTIFYTSEGTHVKRFDVSTSSQLADFNSTALTGTAAYALRLLSPYDGSGGLLVADTQQIVRLNASGAVIQTYPNSDSGAANSETLWFGLNLDPNGTSFWAGDFLSGNFYRFNIATGAVEVGPIATVPFSFSPTLSGFGGICVKGQPASVNSVVLTYPTGTSTQIANFDASDPTNHNSWKATVNANTGFSFTLSKHEVVCDSRVACGGDDFDGVNNYRCRWEEYFNSTTSPADSQLPLGVPYSHNMCVYYRVENPPPDTDIAADILFTVGYNEPGGGAAGSYCASQGAGATRFFRDPSQPPPADAALNHSFAFDFTVGFNPTGMPGDPTISGDTTKTFNDYAVACRFLTGTATFLNPKTTSSYNSGSSVPFKVQVKNSTTGVFITTAATSPNSMPLTIFFPTTSTTPIPTFGNPGGSPAFWTYDYVNNFYTANAKIPKGTALGTYKACVASNPSGSPLFPQVCTTFMITK